MTTPMLIGCPFENGIRMMQRLRRGVTGATAAPARILSKLSTYPQHMLDLQPYQFNVTPATLNDSAAIQHDNALTIAGHAAITTAVRTICRQDKLPLTVGGDHSLTYPLCQAVAQAHLAKRFGLIYLDAHLDMRPLETFANVTGLISSGNSFRRIIEDDTLPIAGHNIVIIGMQPSDSPVFKSMHDFATRHAVTMIPLSACQTNDLAALIEQAVAIASQGTDGVYLSADIDTVDHRFAPGVSAPAQTGLSPSTWLKFVVEIVRQIHLVGFDLVETSARQQGWQTLFEPETWQPDLSEADFDKTATLAAQTVQHIMDILTL